MHYSIRSAKPEDCEQMMRIGHEGLRPYVEQIWEWNQLEQEERFRAQFNPKLTSILQVGGRDVGYFKVEHESYHIFLSGIYIDSNHRGYGLGRKVILDLIEKFNEDERPIRLQVLQSNPAKRLYERLGFVVIDSTETHIKMEYIKTDQ